MASNFQMFSMAQEIEGIFIGSSRGEEDGAKGIENIFISVLGDT